MNRGEFNFAQPWMIPNIIAVTGSNVRRVALNRYGIPYEADELLLTRSGQAELLHQNGNESLIAAYNQQAIPYSVEMAGIKNRAIRTAVKEVHGSDWPPHATIDSTFVVERRRKWFALNKHGNKNDKVEALVQFYDRVRGASIYSNSGVEVFTNKGALRYHLVVLLGIINPDVDLSVLENVIWNHPNYSGGLTTEAALKNGIIIPDPERPFPQLTVEQIRNGRHFLFGRIILGESAASLTYGTDLFFDAATGVLPKDFSFD